MGYGRAISMKEVPLTEVTAIRPIAKMLTNPHLEKPITSITISLADGAKVSAFLIAVTLERDQ